MLVAKELTVAIDFCSMEKTTMEANGYYQMFGYNTLQNIFFCVQQLKEKSGGCLNVDRIFIFGWIYFSKVKKQQQPPERRKYLQNWHGWEWTNNTETEGYTE